MTCCTWLVDLVLVKVFAFLSEQEQEQQQQQQLLKCIFLHQCTTSIISDERTVETQEDLLLFLLQLQHLFDCCESDILRLELPGSWFFLNGWLQRKWHVTLLGETHRSSARRFPHIHDDDVVLVKMLSTRSSSISADLSQWINSFVVVVVVVATFLQDSCCCHPLTVATCPSHLGSITLHICPGSGCWVLLPCPRCKQQWVAACK